MAELDYFAPTTNPEETREKLGKAVRAIWINYCRAIGDTKESHLASWEEISESDREVDRRIAMGIAFMVVTNSDPLMASFWNDLEALKREMQDLLDNQLIPENRVEECQRIIDRATYG